MTPSGNMIRILVVDDSALMRRLIPRLIESDSHLHVIATAMDGAFALKKIEEYRPDVITLDLEMPRMDGIETLRQIMRLHAVPVVVVSAHTRQGAATTFKALNMGAFDFVAKPSDVLAEGMQGIASDLIQKIKAAAASQIRRHRLPAPASPAQSRKAKAMRPASALVPASKVVAIGISTGGPNTLEFMLSQLPADFPAAIAVVQHMPAGFTDPFARRLNESCAVEVKEAQSGDILAAGRVLICPGDRHMRLRRMPLGNVVVLTDDAPVNGHRPSVDVLFRSAAAFGSNAVGVIMTGMGEDGAEALGAMKAAGALTLAQDEGSSIVFGMPRAAIERGHANRIVALEDLANTLIAHYGSPSAVPVSEQYPVPSDGSM